MDSIVTTMMTQIIALSSFSWHKTSASYTVLLTFLRVPSCASLSPPITPSHRTLSRSCPQAVPRLCLGIGGIELLTSSALGRGRLMVNELLGCPVSFWSGDNVWLPPLYPTVSLGVPMAQGDLHITSPWLNANSPRAYGSAERTWVPVQMPSCPPPSLSSADIQKWASFLPLPSKTEVSLQNTSWNPLYKPSTYLWDDWNIFASQGRHCRWLAIIYCC